MKGIPHNLASVVENNADRFDLSAIREAYALAEEAHSGQRRASGEEFVTHAVEVATILAGLGLDTDAVVSGLVHDVVEDTSVDLDEIDRRFGKGVATIVDGVTKISRVEFHSHTEKQVENYRKLLLSMAKDARVILVKLADRLHNMRTLKALTEHQQNRIALETREIYAPLAHRLGMAAIRWELEDLAFKHLEPKAYRDLTKKVRQRRKEREQQVLEMQGPLTRALETAGIQVELTGRPKHLWSIYRKMESRDLPYEEIFDLMAMRVLTENVEDCYAALGIIHSNWTPVQDRFHDFIATPKSNMYQSLHTTVVGPSGRRYEIQIRSHEMHRRAENGIAAHWRYKEGLIALQSTDQADEADEALQWLRQVLDWQKDADEPEEFMEFLRMDLFRGEIFVFTPKGEVKQLPVDATPIDFAYSVHSEIGNHCAGSRINGKRTTLSQKLVNGDTVEILTEHKRGPSRNWLDFVKTSRARRGIGDWVRKEEYNSNLRFGRELFAREIKKAKISAPKEEQRKEAARVLGCDSFEEVLASLGGGEVGPQKIIEALYPGEDPHVVVNRSHKVLERIADRIRRGSEAVKIKGIEDGLAVYSDCCQPIPGDKVMAYIGSGKGVFLHRKFCPSVLDYSDDKSLEIEWVAGKGDTFVVNLEVEGVDRRGLLYDMAKAISNTSTNIMQAEMRESELGVVGDFLVKVKDLTHLNKVMSAMKLVKGISGVKRRDFINPNHLD
ncbi:MAG: bifunctional (p)ppGpp synthetase/guanosine-3',5'-bis(diphosphate) 3'-pyrophosphohydrolase [Longimicrobiales bacterium]|nr:bifunctional (p)ppGpp synthetase/guanosine-3',5'-bis(diphosphate) 3'-pyrophosphohydrolase [Longimicrobiales bacterium]